MLFTILVNDTLYTHAYCSNINKVNMIVLIALNGVIIFD